MTTDVHSGLTPTKGTLVNFIYTQNENRPLDLTSSVNRKTLPRDVSDCGNFD
jgi:hypothetical protein